MILKFKINNIEYNNIKSKCQVFEGKKADGIFKTLKIRLITFMILKNPAGVRGFSLLIPQTLLWFLSTK